MAETKNESKDATKQDDGLVVAKTEKYGYESKKSMTAAEAQQAWLALKVNDGLSNSGNSIKVNGVEIIQVVVNYNGVTFVPVSGGGASAIGPIDRTESVSVEMPKRDDLNGANANGELEG